MAIMSQSDENMFMVVHRRESPTSLPLILPSNTHHYTTISHVSSYISKDSLEKKTMIKDNFSGKMNLEESDFIFENYREV